MGARVLMTSDVRHLVSVWNPSYAADAMDVALAMLLARARDYRAGLLPAEDVYVWWGKVRSADRQAPLPHLMDILSMDADLARDGGAKREIHLYLTDYRSLYVGHVGAITAADIAEHEDETEHVPAFFRSDDVECDCWFQLRDTRRVVADDTVAVSAELEKLRDTRYDDRPVSIYGGMVDLPLIVRRADGARYFDAAIRERLIDGRFWVEFDADLVGIGEIERDLRDNVVGETTWHALDPAARTFVASAEWMFRAHRKDAAFDFAAVVIDLARALEFQANLVLRRGLAAAAESDRRASIDGRSVALTGGELWSLGELARAIGETEHVNQMLKRRLAHGEWFTATLPPILKNLSDVRNPAARAAAMSIDEARKLRDRMLGIGGPGVLAELGRVRPH